MNNYTITNVNNIQINNTPTQDDQVTDKKYVDDNIDESSIIRLNDNSNDRYLQARVGNTAYNLQIYNKAQMIHTTELLSPNKAGYLLQGWTILCNNVNGTGKLGDFVKSTQSSSSTGDSGATALSPIGTAFMFIETSSNNHGSDVYCSWERTDLIHISNVTFYYNRFSTSDASKRAMGRFRIQVLRNNAWETVYTINKNEEFSLIQLHGLY